LKKEIEKEEKDESRFSEEESADEPSIK